MEQTEKTQEEKNWEEVQELFPYYKIPFFIRVFINLGMLLFVKFIVMLAIGLFRGY